MDKTKDLTDLDKLIILFNCAKRGSIGYYDFEDGFFSIAKSTQNVKALLYASQVYAHDLNEYDEALEVAKRAHETFPSKETEENYCRISSAKRYSDSWY
jgi:hypothetical protein